MCTCATLGFLFFFFFSITQIFWDLASLSTYAQDMMATLDIKQHEVLGKGGYGFVCKGELISAVSMNASAVCELEYVYFNA